MIYFLNSFAQAAPYSTINVEVHCDTQSPAGTVSVPCRSFEETEADTVSGTPGQWDQNTLATLASQELKVTVLPAHP